MGGHDWIIEAFWGEFDLDEVTAAMFFYQEIAMGEDLEEFLSPEDALLVLKADLDLRTPLEFGMLLGETTIFINVTKRREE